LILVKRITKTSKMRNLLLLFTVTLFFSGSIIAQSYRTTYTFQKNNYGAAAIQVPYDENVVTEAVKDYMTGKGYKDAHYKDFMIFRSVPLDNSSSAYSDAYFNISKKSRSEKDISIITLIPVKKEATLSTATEEDSSFISKSMVFLDSMVHQIHHYSLTQQIQVQQKALDKTNAKLLSLKNDSGDIAKKIRNYESELAENKTDQSKQTTVISNTATGDQDALAKAHKKMDKLLDNQADYEKKLRNYKADLETNTKDRATQQGLYDKESQSLDALKQRHEAMIK
jgi:hypothetical protein